MCIKIGNNELSAIKGLMTMTLNSIIAEIFNLELEEIELNTRLYDDLHMTVAQEQEFSALLDEYFDGLNIDFKKAKTLDEIYQIVIETEFEDIPEEFIN